MSNEPVKYAIVGAGAIAGAYVDAIKSLDGAALGAVVDVNEQARAKVADATGCAAFENVSHLIDAGAADAVIVCTPPATHEPICSELLNAGVPVLCEKPLCPTAAEAEALVDLADATKTPFSMATKFRFVDDVSEAKRLIAEGAIGDVALFENAFTGRVDMSTRWNSDPSVSGGGVIIDNGTHSVDLIRHFLGPVVRVQAVEGPRIQGLEVEDNAILVVQTDNRVVGTVDLSWSINKELDTYVQVYGTGGAIKLGWKGAWIKKAGESDWTSFGTGYSKVGAFANQIKSFEGVVRRECDPLVTPRDALASVRVIDAAYESIKRDDWVAVEPERV